MNLDDLISKYVDGELNQNEDNELRKILSEDESARDAFDTDVFIHSAIKEESENIRPSARLLSETEDRVLMKILASQPIVGDTVYPRRKYFAFASAVMAILILGFLKINDFQIFNDKMGLALILEQERRNIDNSYILSQIESEGPELLTIVNPHEKVNVNHSAGLLARTSNVNSSRNNNTVVSIASNTGSVIGNENMQFSVGTENSEIVENLNTVSTKTDMRLSSSDGNNISNKDNMTTDNLKAQLPVSAKQTNSVMLSPEKTIQMNPSNITMNNVQPSVVNPMNNPFPVNQNFYGTPTNIRLASFFGTNLMNTGFEQANLKNSQVISNFSQSIACELTSSQRIGLELGYSQFSYDDQRIGRIPTSSVVRLGDITSKRHGVEELYPSGDGNNITFPYTVNVNKQILWGSAFYEQVIFNIDNLSFTGRLGVGGTNDGALGYAKFYGQYDLFKWLSVTVGADGRYFKSAINSQLIQSNDWKSSLSIIYGFQLKM